MIRLANYRRTVQLVIFLPIFMLHTYAARFDVIENLDHFAKWFRN